MNVSRGVRNGAATRSRPRVLLATVTIAVLTAAACSGEAGVEATGALGSGALDEPVRSADRPVTPSPSGVGALAYFLDGDLYVADWNGANPLRIVNGRPGKGGCTDEFWAEGTIWSPDGRYLAARHARGCQNGRSGWWDAVIIDPEGEVVASIPSEGWLISWSPDSTRVAVWITWGETIGVYGLDGERQAVLDLPGGLMAPGDFDPVWSSDGESLLVPYGVEIPLDGSAPRQLPPDDPRSQDAAYSPDGLRVAYIDQVDHVGSLVVAAADGSIAREVIAPWVQRPIWSPTGDRIAFVYSERDGLESTELRVLDVATGEVTSLVAGRGGSDLIWGVIEFSPRGDRILFSRTDDQDRGVSSLWTINVDGSDPRRSVTGTVWGDWGSLTPTP
jgi:Tol biopolymer transport system component